MLKKVIIGAVSLIVCAALFAESVPTPESGQPDQNVPVAQNGEGKPKISSFFGGTSQGENSPGQSAPIRTEEGVVQIKTSDDVVESDNGGFGQPMIGSGTVDNLGGPDENGMVNGEFPPDSL